jgi:hypothetical protein
VDQAFANDPSERESWKKKIERAKSGKPDDSRDKVVERAEKVEHKGPKEKAKFTDLLQFLDQDTSGR